MASFGEQQVLAALKSVMDPERGRDLVSLGMVSGIAIRDGNVVFSIETEPARAAALEPVRKAAEKAVEAIPGVLSVTALLTGAKAPQAQAPHHDHHGHGHSHAAPAAPRQPPKSLVPGAHAIVAVALALQGLKVGLLDADVYGPSQPRMLGISGRPRSPDGRILEPMQNYGVSCMSIGFLVPEDTATIWRGPMVMGALQQMMRDVAWGELDILLVDMPPGTGDAQLTMAQQVPLAGAIIVSTPQDIALLDARKGLNMFAKVEVPVLGIIENMSYFCCPNCGHRTDIFSHGGARLEAEKLNAEFLGEIPLDIRIRETSDAGTPIVVAEPDSALAKSYMEIAARVWEKVSGAPTRQGPKITMA